MWVVVEETTGRGCGVERGVGVGGQGERGGGEVPT